jgi:hypothetical protein
MSYVMGARGLIFVPVSPTYKDSSEITADCNESTHSFEWATQQPAPVF